ncbi:MAG: Ig-like domain-containing protein, partial [Bacteroidia bacterium]|nr:Ig-like domain-containing protein [Bacteroidia bacterium]
MFPANLGSTATYTLFISGGQATSGNVSIPGIGFTQDFTVTPGEITSVQMPSNVAVNTSNVIENKGIRVTSNDEITIYGLNRQQFTTDAFLALPEDILGQEYLSLGYRRGLVTAGLEYLAIVGTRDGTVVTITPKVSAGVRPAGVSYDITLNAGQTYQLKSTGALTGSVITATAPIAVFGGNVCANIPPNTQFCDHLVEQLFPEDAWGTNFLTVPLKTRRGDTFIVLAGEDGTTVNVTGRDPQTINRGEFTEFILGEVSSINATKPVLVAQYSNGSNFDGALADPFMLLIPPSEQYEGQYTVATPASGFRRNFINIISSNTGIGSLTLNGDPIDNSLFVPIEGTTFSGAQVDISLGTFNLNGNEPFGVFVYGFDDDDSYGYPGGTTLAPIARASSLNVTPDDSPVIEGETFCVLATVLDSLNQPLPGIRVDLNVTGANQSFSFGNTNADGQVTLCYTAGNIGADQVTVSASTLSESFTVEVKERPIPTTLILSPDTLMVKAGQEICVSAQLLDQNGNPMANSDLEFNVEGANEFADNLPTNENGIARFCYVPANVGTDQVS